jgi:hypothetical protein
MRTSDNGEALADRTRGASDGSCRLSGIFDGGFDFVCVGQGGCPTVPCRWTAEEFVMPTRRRHMPLADNVEPARCE